MRNVPLQIATARLLLRRFEPSDAPALYAALLESIDALRCHLAHLSWVAETPTLGSAEARCRKARADFDARADLPYLAFERASGRLVASAGLHRTDWALPRTEVGYWVRSTETGRGYATESVLALTGWALDTLGAQRVDLVTDARNHGSRRVAVRCGFRLEVMEPAETKPGQADAQRQLCRYVRTSDRPAPP